MNHYSQHSLNSVSALAPGTKENCSPAQAAAKPDFLLYTSQGVAVTNAWYGRRAAFRFDDPRLPLSFTARFRPDEPAQDNLVALNFTIADALAQIIAPDALLAEFIAEYGVNYATLSPRSALLLLEHRLSRVFGAIERALNDAIVPQEILPLRASPLAEKALCLHASCEVKGKVHWIKLILPLDLAQHAAEWLSTLPSPETALADIPVTLAIRAGFAQLTVEELGSLALNDVLLADSPLPQPEMLAVFGERYGARVHCEDRTVTFLETLFPLSDEQRKVWSMTDTGNEAAETQPLDGNLGEIQIKLTFEVGRKEIELGNLRSLAAGHVFELGRDPRTAVDILAGTRRIGQGELVRIDQTLGIRVTRLFNYE